MPIDPTRLCKCHGEAMYWNSSQHEHLCVIKRRVKNARYGKSDKGRATRVSARRRYNNTEKGQATNKARSQRRIRVGAGYHSMAVSIEQAQAINGYVRRRINEFEQGRAARKEAQGAA